MLILRGKDANLYGENRGLLPTITADCGPCIVLARRCIPTIRLA